MENIVIDFDIFKKYTFTKSSKIIFWRVLYFCTNSRFTPVIKEVARKIEITTFYVEITKIRNATKKSFRCFMIWSSFLVEKSATDGKSNVFLVSLEI